MKVTSTNKWYLKNLLKGYGTKGERLGRGAQCPSYFLSYAFVWGSSPQGHDYWVAKQRDFNNRIYEPLLADSIFLDRNQRAWEETLTEEDWAFFRHLCRDKRKTFDPFLKAKANPEENSY